MKSRAFLVATFAFYFSICAAAQDRAALDALFLQATQLEQSDPARADRLYDEAARQGHTLSMVKLGYRITQSSSDPQQLARAFSLFNTAAKAGNLDGQFLLALSYLQGIGTEKNPAAARAALLVPADHGNQYAQYTLGIMLQAGEGGPKREAAARRWLDRAAHGSDSGLAARASDIRDKLDAKLFSSDDSVGNALTALFFIALVGAAMGGGSGGGGSSAGSTMSSSGMGSSASSPPPCRPTPYYPTNITKSVNGDLTSSSLQWHGC
jgi:Sel1 repeat